MPTIARQVSASNQDCLAWRDFFHNWQFSLTHKETKVGFSSLASYAMGAGLYFPNIDIPPGSTILRAYLILRSAELHFSREVVSRIELEENSNPTPFSTAADYWARPRLYPFVWWIFDRYSRWRKDELYGSPDFSDLIQRIIDLPGWAEGNPIVVFWNDHNNNSEQGPEGERVAYSYDENMMLGARLEITYRTPTPPPVPDPPLPPPPPPDRKGWTILDLQYTYLDDGFTIVATTDVPCHLFCRMTTTPPRKHSLPSYRRGLYLTGDIRFCFVVYEDNEQAEGGDTLIHTFVKDAWPICETRWFYFVGTAYGDPSPSESPIFKFHFPAPPPEPPPPMERYFIAQANNRTIQSRHVFWPTCWSGSELRVFTSYGAPLYRIDSYAYLTARYGIRRGFLTFDTSILPDTAIIQSAQLLPYVFYAKRTSSAGFPYWQVTKGHQSDPVVTGDWGAQNPETTILGQLDYATLTTGQYNPIDLNAAGLSHINLTGLTKYCLRAQLDVENQVPPLGENSAAYYSQQKDVPYYPMLKVTYYPA